ncbi:MAG: hypothetical protein II297_01505 [Clostridia bacterium]|nr:hypothetical protein [Clostridia bacterium]
MSEILEIAMVCLFGASWPMNVIKSYKTRTAKGKSIMFLMFIWIGYVCGIAAKLTAETFKWYVLMFYVINIIMVTADILLYFRNVRLDRAREEK